MVDPDDICPTCEMPTETNWCKFPEYLTGCVDHGSGEVVTIWTGNRTPKVGEQVDSKCSVCGKNETVQEVRAAVCNS